MFSRSFSFVSCWHSHDMNKTESIPIRFQYLFPQTIPDQHPDQKTIITCGPCTGMAAFRSKLAYQVCWLSALLPDSPHKTLMLRPNSRFPRVPTRKNRSDTLPKSTEAFQQKARMVKKSKTNDTRTTTWPLQAGAPAEQHAAPGAPAMGIACVKDLMSWLRPTALRLPSQ